MSRTRTLIITLALAAILPVAVAHLTGCEESPDAPVFDNPFDPDGPLGGDGLQVRATTGSNVITVTWDHYPGRNITEYIIDHRTDLDPEWTALADTLLEDDDMSTVSYYHVRPAPNRTHEYLVQGLTADGDFTMSGYATPASAGTPPLVLHDATFGKAPSRYLNLKIITGEGDSIRVADNPDFTGALEIPAAAPGDTAYATWDYGLRADGDTLYNYVQSFTTGSYLSETFTSKVTVEFEPDFSVIGGVSSGTSFKVPHVVNDLRVDAQGVEQMRFASEEADLALAAWVPGDTVYTGFVLQPTAAEQSIWGEFQGDFGFNSTGSIRVRADMLEDATFTLDLPANGVTTHTRVGVRNFAAADSMRFADSPVFPAGSWRPYADADSVDFTGTPGKVEIYGQFKNDWNTSIPLTDSLTFTLVPLDVYFVTPPDGGTIEGGTTFDVTGRAISADGALLTTVQVDLGDGFGWRTVPPIQDWTLSWNVPTVTEDTPFLLRVMATTATETANTAITVTVQPPAP